MERLGSKFDGGYVLPRSVIESASMLLSFGVNDDWNLEIDFLEQSNDLIVHCFDASVSGSTFMMRAFKSLLRLRFKSFAKYCQTCFSYNRFFRTKAKHHKKYIADYIFGDYIDFNEIERTVPEVQNATNNSVVLKIDIEGGEYRLLEAILERKEKYSCILIEFHDFDLHQNAIQKFTEDLGFAIVNFHANNCASVNKDNVPLVVEVTLVSNELVSGTSNINKLNAPCCPQKEELVVVFS